MTGDKKRGLREVSAPWIQKPADLYAQENLANDPDAALRAGIFEYLQNLTNTFGQIGAAQFEAGFEYKGERIPLINPRRGIYKPRQMRHLLSIKTVFPKPGARIWYDDQTQVHQQIYQGDDVVDYAFMGNDPEAAENRWLRDAWEKQIPIIYFLGIAPGLYQAFMPVFVIDWDPKSLKARITFGEGLQSKAAPATSVERRYALRVVKQRLHQASFRSAVMQAYDARCALSRLPEPLLLDAAHIVSDMNEKWGQPVVSNGLPLSKIHHAAFDAHLIGVDPDYKIHVSDRLLRQKDGPMLEALKLLRGQSIYLPARVIDYPDKDRLAERFSQYKAAAS